MWHHLLPFPERDALFADYPGNGAPLPLVQSFLAAVRDRMRGGWPYLGGARFLPCDDLPALERAFGRAVEDVLGQVGVPMVTRAWCEMMDAFLNEVCRRDAA